MEPEQLKQSIEKALPGSLVEVTDVNGNKNHFHARVVAEQFAGKSLVEQHQMVYKALEDEIQGDLHAVSLKTFTPEAWQRSRSSP